MAAAGFFFSSLGRQRAARALSLLRRLSYFPFSPPPPPPCIPRLCRPFSPEPHRIMAGLLSPLPPSANNLSGACGFGVELVDPDLWRVSSALSHAWGEPEAAASLMSDEMSKTKEEEGEKGEGDCPDLEEIEELRLRKKLFYKLDRGSMEFEECSLSLFRRQKSKSKRKKLPKIRDNRKSAEPNRKEAVLKMESPKPKKPTKPGCDAKVTSPSLAAKEGFEEDGKKRRERTPTFNQLTDPYHLPFCLDIYVSKGSVRACIVHRGTSKVVAVAHSISKDMKFDLSSRRDTIACTAVGAALAQRALSDDIHNVVYTPRKGEKIEGKIQVVLQSIMDNGVDVKVKIKQRKPLKGRTAAC